MQLKAKRMQNGINEIEKSVANCSDSVICYLFEDFLKNRVLNGKMIGYPGKALSTVLPRS